MRAASASRSVAPPPGQGRAQSRDDDHEHQNGPEPCVAFAERNAANVHPEHPWDDRERQRQHRDDGQDEQRRLVCSLISAISSSCSRRIRSTSAANPTPRPRAPLPTAADPDSHLAQPGRRPVQQPEQCGRFRREQPLQPHEHAAQRAELGTARRLMRDDAILDRIDLLRGVADDLDQDVGLIAKEVRQQFGGRAERLAGLTEARRRSMARSCVVRALTISRSVTHNVTVAADDASAAKNCTSLITPSSASSTTSTRVDDLLLDRVVEHVRQRRRAAGASARWRRSSG